MLNSNLIKWVMAGMFSVFSTSVLTDDSQTETNALSVMELSVFSDKAYGGNLKDGLVNRGIENYNPVAFDINRPLTHSPCEAEWEKEDEFGDLLDQDALYNRTLLIRRQDVMSGDQIENYTVSIDLEPSNFGGVGWNIKSLPLGASEPIINGSTVTFNTPSVGGLYEVTLNYKDTETTANFLLPLAGADIIDWLDKEVRTYASWVRALRAIISAADFPSTQTQIQEIASAKAETERALSIWGEPSSPVRLDTFDYFVYVSSLRFDYKKFIPRNAENSAPCMRFFRAQTFSDNAVSYGFVTVNGKVIQASKINNMLWSVFGHYWGWKTFELVKGATFNERDAKGQRDPETSRNSIVIGYSIYRWLLQGGSGHLSSVLTPEVMELMIAGDDDSGFWHRWLWPAEAMDESKNEYTAPDLLVPNKR